MATPSQFRQYLIAQDEEGNNIEVTRSSTQVGVLAFDVERQVFVHCQVILEPLKDRKTFEERGRKILEHPHGSRARLFEFGEDDGNAFYITENVDGETLRSYLASQSVVPAWLAMSLTVQVLEAMNALLEAGCPMPEHPLESMRVWQSGTHSIKALVANYPLTEESEDSAIKPKQAKMQFIEEANKLGVFFSECMQRAGLGDEPQVEAARLAELLSDVLQSFSLEAKAGFKEALSIFETRMPLPPAAELAASLSPQPLLASFLKDSQTVARSLMQSVRIPSQKVNPANPYALRGALIKSGQAVSIEQVPPERMTGQNCREALAQMLNLSKTGKFANLLPVLFLHDQGGFQCMGEPMVEGLALSDILEARRSLDPYEIHLILNNLSTALGILEGSRQPISRLRLEDIFLFTGPVVEKSEIASLAKSNLVEWPSFSIVLRSYACLHSMSGRGTNPAAFLSAKPVKKKDVEPLWHGGWFASLTCILLGLPRDSFPHQRTGIAEIDGIISLLDEEMKRERKGTPSSRAAFLSRYTREISKHAPSDVPGVDEWSELSGATMPQRRAPDSDAMNPAALSPHAAITGEVEQPVMGFAEALIQHRVPDEPEFIGGLRPMRAAPQTLRHDDFESSWITVHEKKSLWWHIFWILIGSMLLAMMLAHLSGRAFWQKITPATAFEIESMEVSPVRDTDSIELPVASGGAPGSNIAKLPVPPPLLPEIDPGSPTPVSNTPKKNDTPAPVIEASKSSPMAANTAGGFSKSSESLTAQLQLLRKEGKALPAGMREETERAARTGNKEAMLALGNLFLRGVEEGRDERAAFQWYDQANKAGEAAAALPLAECYLQGWGTKPDFTQAVNLLTKASMNGEFRAKDLLAVCYARGIGVTRDDARALALFTEAYNGGVPSACGNLGAMYLRGQGTAPDAERATKLFAEGAGKNQADSMLLYAQSLEYGTGTAVNPQEAKLWYQKAARSGNAEAANWCRKNSVAY